MKTIHLLRTTQSALGHARQQMAMSGATPDALHEVNDDLNQLEAWAKQTRSTMDEAMVRKTASRWLKIYLDYSYWGDRLLPSRRKEARSHKPQHDPGASISQI